MKPKIEEGRHVPVDAGMLRIRLECLKLAAALIPPGAYRQLEGVEDVANGFLRYVLTGAMQEPEPVKPQYKPVEVTDAEGLQ